MKKIFLAVLGLALAGLLISGCVTLDETAKEELTFSNYTGTFYEPKPQDYPVDLFFKGRQEGPQKDYEVIGEISGTIDEGYYDLGSLLSARARQVGGDGLADIELSADIEKESQVVDVKTGVYPGDTMPVLKTRSYEVSKVKAKVIRYVFPPNVKVKESK